jgi:hypothetical protein
VHQHKLRVMNSLRIALLLLFFAASVATDLSAQAREIPPGSAPRDSSSSAAGLSRFSMPLVTSDEVDRLRSDQLIRGVRPGESLLLRSASSLAPAMPVGDRRWQFDFIEPQLLTVRNSGLPFSQNNSAMWAGRGISTRVLLGFRVEVPYASLTIAPQIVNSQNLYWLRRHPGYFEPLTPLAYIGRGYTFPYYFYTFPIDHPVTFGDSEIRKFDLGESTAMISARGVEVGVSNENQWWGPGIRNAMLLSNNAPGFPHLFVRTGKPIRTPLGGVDIRWLVGALEESRYFDTLATNDVRSLAAIGATLQSRWDPNLTLGVARSVYGTAAGWEDIPFRLADVIKPATQENDSLLAQVLEEPPVPGGRDQLFTLFARWVFPRSGAEVYAEWGRTKLPQSLGAFLRAPNHTQGYTIGLQWRGKTVGPGDIRFQGEITQLEQSATFRDGPVGSWYTSSRVVHGYTNQGQVIGASIGPGASSQFFAGDYLARTWQAGLYAGRIRTNEDVHSTYGFPSYVSYCNHDVSVFPGARAAYFSRFGILSADLLLQNRMNVLFQNRGGCPNTGDRLDLRNSSFTLRFSPVSFF